jgi:hypothetical protein
MINAFDNYQSNRKLGWYCHQSLVKLAEHNRLQPIRFQFTEVLRVMKLPINFQDWNMNVLL